MMIVAILLALLVTIAPKVTPIKICVWVSAVE